MISVRRAAGLKQIANVSLRKSGLLKGIANVWLRTAGGLEQVHDSGSSGAFAVTVSPPAVYGGASTGTSTNISTGTCTAVPVGGLGPYTYAWALIADDGSTWSIESPTSATTRFRCSGVLPGAGHTATFRCTVTDARGLTAFSDDVDANITNYGFAP